MHHIFATSAQREENGNVLRVTGEDYHHMVHVLRMKAGEELSVSFTDEMPAGSGQPETPEIRPGDHAEYRFGIEDITEDAVICRLRFVKRDTAELPVRVILLQGLPKGDKMEQIIEKNTELGVSEIVPVALKRCVVKLDEKKAASRVARWNKIAQSAAKQARRGVIPEVTRVMTLKEALSYAGDADCRLIPYELLAEGAFAENPKEPSAAAEQTESGMPRTRRLLEGIAAGQSVAVLIGPEGGFTEEEVALSREAGFHPVSLGGRILRTETAGMTVMAWIAYRF